LEGVGQFESVWALKLAHSTLTILGAINRI
jgi:hypothetical protein